MGKGEGRGRCERGRADGRGGWGLTSMAGILLWWSLQIKAGGGGRSEMQISRRAAVAEARCRGGWGRWPERDAEGNGESGRSRARANEQSESGAAERERARSIGLRRREMGKKQRWPVEIFG
jgi:hypothetical protein